ncbi:MAG: dephospho-CoA kinase [Bacilli bacterium]|nr:dephospho-CoA kinase [Bacilli bacterium]MBN2696116.1 dephospho-CoA kinase [Bacilli bacterium]
MQVIGLTGGIASGKSIVSKLFLEAGVPVIDADFVYKQLSKPYEVLYNEITLKLEDVPLNPDKSIDWHKLGEIVFNDPEFREKLNDLTHPIVISEIEDMLAKYRDEGEKLVVISVPLLFEANVDRICDKTVLVYINRELQVSRLMQRDQIDRDFAMKKIDSQMSLEDKLERADYAIDNSGTLQETKAAFESLLTTLRSE